MKRARWTKLAQADFARIDDFYQPLAPGFADSLADAALRSARFLGENPGAGSIIEGDLRKWRITSFDYVLLYRTVPGGIEILRMHHARENWRQPVE